MKPLLPLALSLLAVAVFAQETTPFDSGVNAANIKAVLGYTLPAGAAVGPELWKVDEFYTDNLFGPDAKQCVAASTALSEPAADVAEGWTEVKSYAYVLAGSGGNTFQLYRFWVAEHAKGRNKKAEKKALGKLKLFQDNLTKAIAAAKRC